MSHCPSPLTTLHSLCEAINMSRKVIKEKWEKRKKKKKMGRRNSWEHHKIIEHAGSCCNLTELKTRPLQRLRRTAFSSVYNLYLRGQHKEEQSKTAAPTWALPADPSQLCLLGTLLQVSAQGLHKGWLKPLPAPYSSSHIFLADYYSALIKWSRLIAFLFRYNSLSLFTQAGEV